MASLIDQLTSDAVLTLAPDSGSARAAQKLARPAQWPTLAREGDVLWGECQGSGAHPYLVGVDARTAEIASKCTCPSRKFPCKHALGLMLLRAARAGEWQGASPPPDLAKWLGGRVVRAEKAAQPPEDAPEDAAAQAKAQQKAQAARDRKRSAGLEDLELWLSDLVREGIQAARARPYGDWDRQAARLVDAQLAGAARQVRQIPELLHDDSTDNGGEALTAHLGRLWLLTQGWRQRDSLNDSERADLMTALGAPLDRASVPPATPRVWQALGSVQEEEGKLNVRRTWLLGEGQELALLLDFAPTGQALPAPLAPGQPFAAAVAYAPSAHAQRAILQGEAMPAAPLPLPGGTLAGMQGRYAAALALNPWLERIGAFVGPAYLNLDPPQLCDARGHAVSLSARVEQADLWAMLAHAETRTQTYFGEWDGVSFVPVGAVSAEVVLPQAEPAETPTETRVPA